MEFYFLLFFSQLMLKIVWTKYWESITNLIIQFKWRHNIFHARLPICITFSTEVASFFRIESRNSFELFDNLLLYLASTRSNKYQFNPQRTVTASFIRFIIIYVTYFDDILAKCLANLDFRNDTRFLLH